MKHKKIKIFLLTAILLFGAAFASCSFVKDINYSYLKSEKSFGYETEGAAKILTSEQSFIEFINQLNLNDAYQNQIKSGTMKEYDGEFFDDHNLIAFKIADNFKGSNTKIEDYSIDGEVISITAKTTEVYQIKSREYFYYFLELTKRQMRKISKVNVIRVDGNDVTVYENKLLEIDENAIIVDENIDFSYFASYSASTPSPSSPPNYDPSKYEKGNLKNIDSKESFDSFIAEFCVNQIYKNPNEKADLNEYDEAFFQNHSLIAFFHYETKKGKFAVIDRYTVSHGVLSITAESFGGMLDAMDGRYYLIEIPKSNLETITQIKIYWLDSFNRIYLLENDVWKLIKD